MRRNRGPSPRYRCPPLPPQHTTFVEFRQGVKVCWGSLKNPCPDRAVRPYPAGKLRVRNQVDQQLLSSYVRSPPRRYQRDQTEYRSYSGTLQTHPDSWVNVERCPHFGVDSAPVVSKPVVPVDSEVGGRASRVLLHDGRASIGISTDAQWGCLPSSTAV